MAATDTFTSYEKEWLQVKQAVQMKLATDCKQQRGEQKKATIRRLGMELDEAEEIIDQMENEGKGKARMMMTVRTAKAELKALRSAVQTESNVSDRDALLSMPDHQAYDVDVDDSEAYPSSASAQRSRLLGSTQVLKTSDGRLTNASRVAAESEEIGANVLESLRGQGAQLANARDQLEEADGSINRASGTVSKMIRTMYKTRFMIWSFAFVLTLLIILILWNKFR